jgi:predicted CoA-substrate-specific enzyme activase
MTGSHKSQLMIGLDVGSTTVKAVVMKDSGEEILWKGYRRHETRQPETVLSFLESIEREFDVTPGETRVFITGSGGAHLAPYIGARFVQEVNAISLAVETLYPDTGSVIEIGGQDSKVIIWSIDEKSGKKVKTPSMNDKCAGGTGAVIDKISSKLGLSQDSLQALPYNSEKIHPVAGRCGVFAETDINSLQKQGIPAEELMNSLFEAIVQQNLSVLTRGNTLLPNVLLLGGPHTYIPALVEAWKRNIPAVWRGRNFPFPPERDMAEAIAVPKDSQYFGAIGVVIFGRGEDREVGLYKGIEPFREFVESGQSESGSRGEPPFFETEEERTEFVGIYGLRMTQSHESLKGEVKAYIGIDGGSTSTKGVILDGDGNLIAKAYRLSAGNPLEDTKWVIREMRREIDSRGIRVRICGVGTTGYAKDMLKEAIRADVAIVETVAHTKSALRYFNNVDVICDVGGQDIKVILIKDGRVVDFKLNTQCSAGNGYFLQSTAAKFGYEVDEYASAAFSAKGTPVFGYGCAVFLESDIVNFQQMGWRREEILAGLARVLPKNIWLYVVQEPNLKKLGRRFVLQGGTQKNLAAVKAQYDFIRSKVHDAEVFVHPYTGESGAIGAAIEAMGEESSFIGFEAMETLSFSAQRNEGTRCAFCKNKCMRTFLDLSDGTESRRYIIAPCEKGAVENKEDMLSVRERLEGVKNRNPDLSATALRHIFRKEWLDGHPVRSRRDLRIGIPRILNIYSTAPFFSAYLESAGIDPKNIVFSDVTNEEMFREGSRRGSIDQCYPSKAALAHVHNLVYRKEVDVILSPIIINLPTFLENTMKSLTCPTVQTTPDVCRAAFSKENDLFASRGIRYLSPVLNFSDRDLMEREMHECFGPLLGIGKRESREGVSRGYEAIDECFSHLREAGKGVLRMLEREERVGLVLLGRPYHNDPGLNHGILEEIQKRGYPILTIDSLPVDEYLHEFFGDELMEGVSPLEISDVWKNSYAENSNRKIWGAKFVARHPNLAALDLSNFKCGHDSPIYAVVERILHTAGTPYFTFHDIDENKPSGSIKIRVETIDYFLRQYEGEIKRRAEIDRTIEEMAGRYKSELASAYQIAGSI